MYCQAYIVVFDFNDKELKQFVHYCYVMCVIAHDASAFLKHRATFKILLILNFLKEAHIKLLF